MFRSFLEVLFVGVMVVVVVNFLPPLPVVERPVDCTLKEASLQSGGKVTGFAQCEGGKQSEWVSLADINNLRLGMALRCTEVRQRMPYTSILRPGRDIKKCTV